MNALQPSPQNAREVATLLSRGTLNVRPLAAAVLAIAEQDDTGDYESLKTKL